MRIRHLYSTFFFFFILFIGNNFGQANNKPITSQASPQNTKKLQKYQDYVNNYREVSIEIEALQTLLQGAPMIGLATKNKKSSIIIELPMPNGDVHRFRVVESPILSPELASTRPDVKSYAAQGIDDPTATLRFNITHQGFYGVISGINGISIIEPIDKYAPNDKYITYYDHDIQTQGGFTCEADGVATADLSNQTAPYDKINSCFQNGANLRTYEIILTCSGEFYGLNNGGAGDADVEAALLARMTQINAVYEKEVAISFTIVEYLLNSNAGTDPFSNPLSTFSSITETENYINANASVSFDIGHGFHEITCGGGCGWAGRAGVGVVCRSGKAAGYTYLPNDIPSNITVVLHEFGHMFSCYHSNYGCNSNNACGRYEPGQGSSIMSTSAGCDAGDFFANRTDYFGIGSLQAIMDYTSTGSILPSGNPTCTTFVGFGWADCSASSGTGNNPPTSNANSASINGLKIPHSTPFILQGSGSDPDVGNALTYSWEQYDIDYAGSAAPDDAGANTLAPLFRSFPPSTSLERTCPQLNSILAGNVSTGTGEILPTVARTLTWRFTVRDNVMGGGGIACDEISLTVSVDGPFQISSQNMSTGWNAGATETITWDVANTDDASYNCANIDILYSSDGGITFGTTLASNVPNDGSQNITVPATATTTGRIKIICTGDSNIFFDINNVNIAIISGCTANGGAISNNTAVSEMAGNAALNLSLYPGVAITMNSGTLDAGDNNANIAVENNGSGTCTSFGNNPDYETFEFSVSSNSNYTVSRVTSGYSFGLITLYEPTYNPVSVCTNWQASNSNFISGMGTFVSSQFTHALEPGKKYTLVSSGFSGGSFGTYTNTFSGGGTVYNTGNTPGAGFSYTYVIVNTATNLIIAIDANSDLSNAGTFPAATYAVHGLDYLSGTNLVPYVGGTLANLQNATTMGTFCGDFSTNNVAVTIAPVLPIELIDFSGKRLANQIQLDWQTATEIDNDYFTIEKSIDGRNFEMLSTVKGAGSSAQLINYQIFDKHPFDGINYYRLQQRDFDGSLSYSDVIAVNFERDNRVAIYPNPVRKNSINLSYLSTERSNIAIEIIDVAGRLVSQAEYVVSKGQNTLGLDVSNYQDGIYILRIRQGDVAQTIRFVRLR